MNFWSKIMLLFIKRKDVVRNTWHQVPLRLIKVANNLIFFENISFIRFHYSLPSLHLDGTNGCLIVLNIVKGSLHATKFSDCVIVLLALTKTKFGLFSSLVGRSYHYFWRHVPLMKKHNNQELMAAWNTIRNISFFC
jgi:hypothetical protein